MIDTNVKGLLTMTRLVVPGMVKRGCGQIINIGSVAGDAAYAGGNVYCATKAAVKTITDGLRIVLADTALRVTNIKPGLVETNFSRTRFPRRQRQSRQRLQGIKPLTGDDLADVALYAAEAPAHVQIAEGGLCSPPIRFRLGDCEEIIPGASGITLAALCRTLCK